MHVMGATHVGQMFGEETVHLRLSVQRVEPTFDLNGFAPQTGRGFELGGPNLQRGHFDGT